MRRIHQLIGILTILFLTIQNPLFAATDPYESLPPGKATGRIKVNAQGFLIKYAYARKSIAEKEDKDKADYIILLTNRTFPEDFSKIDRFEISRYAARYDLQGLLIGVNKDRQLVFADILRLRSITGSVEFKPSSNEDDLIEGRLYTNGQQQYLHLKYEIDITFSTKP
ncbi:MAG TPA: hypothetical protein VLH08_20570 [Acidobacteriota bacterium]|nr:hypothetical protein [Acidobacteriota bacterium]